jgi:hypothetical protein
MRLAIMQPYLFPYLGYFQLLDCVDAFILYDNIQYTKKGWINRNRILLNGEDHMFTVPLQKDSDYLNVNERFLSETASKEINKILGQIKSSYSKAPYFKEVFPLVESIFLCADKNLFNYVLNSINGIKNYLSIETPIVISSAVNIDHSSKGKDKVISFCKALQAGIYLNPIGGMGLYNKQEFFQNGIILEFLRMNDIEYSQGDNEFVKALSVIDVMMFNSKQQIRNLLNKFTIK